MMQDDNLTCEDYYIESRPTTSSRVFHWEHLSPEAQDIIKDTINHSIGFESDKLLIEYIKDFVEEAIINDDDYDATLLREELEEWEESSKYDDQRKDKSCED